MDLELVPIHSDELGIEILMPTSWDDGAWEPFVERGAITRQEVDIMHKEYDRFSASPDKYAIFATWMVSGMK
jgi:hypothetical protein